MESQKESDPAEKRRESGESSGDSGTRPPADATTTETAAKPKGPSIFKKIATALELDVVTVLLLMKGGLPPAIALALLQVDTIANYFSTIGYLVAIISVIGMAVMPRAKFIQTLITNLVLLCIGAAMALLVGYSSTQARLHTSAHTAAAAQQYNSSSSAVCAIWLFFQVFLSNAMRAQYPQLQLPVILYSIFSVVSCITMPRFPTMPYVISFVEKLLEAFLTGLAIATAVHFLVLPLSVRTIMLKQFAGYVGLLQKSLKVYQAYLTSLEDPENVENAIITDRTKDYKPNPIVAQVSGTVEAITGLHGKIQGDLPLAKREVAIGKIGPDDLSAISKLLRAIMLPTVGLSALGDLLERVAFFHGWSQKHLDEGLTEDEKAMRSTIVKEWADNLKALHNPIDSIIAVSCEGLDHVALQLQFKKPEKPASTSVEGDIEAEAQATRPGDAGFAEYMQTKIDEYYGGKKEMLREWCNRHGIELAPDFFEKPRTAQFSIPEDHESSHERNQRQLYLLLYMEYLLYSAAKSILAMVKFSDELVSNGTMSKTRLIMPGWRRLKKWLKTFLNPDEGPNEEPRGDLGDFNKEIALVDLGSAYNVKKDPEHLPPRNMAEKIGNGIRHIPHILRSDAASFGFRVAAATMSIGVAAFLKQTQGWFQLHRALWALIMIAISMTPTAGQSVFSFVLRIAGTVVAMVVSFICYYVPDKHPAGVIVFVWLFTSIGMWVPLKRQPLAVVGVISIVTNILIIGYTLGVDKLGKVVATSNGQEYLPIYELGPYRLASVAAGLAIAFIFTILPYPISEHSLLRRNVGGSLYLLANYYSVIHESIQARIKDAEGDPNDKDSLGARLAKLRLKVFTKQILMLTNLRTFAAFQKFEIPIGGRFPKEQYEILVKSIDNITRYISLLSYSSQNLQEDPAGDHHLSQWSKDLKQVLGAVGHTSNEITSLLSLLSASMANGQPLPPYMTTPKPYLLSRKLEALDPDILSVRHIDEPEYAIFAVFQVASRCIIFELDTLLRIVKELVGELDFSFHVVKTASSSRTALAEQEDDDPAKYPEGYKKKGD